MKLASEFAVPASPAQVFAALLDPDTMRGCIPGCEELERVDEAHYRGRLVNTVAHVRFDAAFSAEVTAVTRPEAVRAVLRGEDRTIASAVRVDATVTVRPDGAASVVGYGLDVAIRGRLGRLGEAVVRRRTAEVERQFVAAFTSACASAQQGAEP